ATAASSANPFGLQPGAAEASTGQEDFSSVPADLQRSNIIALLDTPAPGSLLAQQRQLQAQATNTAVAQTQAAIQAAAPTQQAAIAAQANSQNSTNGLAGAMQRTDAALNFQEQVLRPGEFASNREVQTFGELVRQLNMDPLVLVNFLIDHRARLDGAVMGPGFYFIGPNVALKDLFQADCGPASGADESSVELVSTVVDS